MAIQSDYQDMGMWPIAQYQALDWEARLVSTVGSILLVLLFLIEFVDNKKHRKSPDLSFKNTL